MARSKHRKAHKQALSNYRDILAAAAMVRQENQPKEVGKKKFQVPPQDPNWISATIGVQTEQGLEATLESGGKIILTQGGMPLQKGDRVQINYPLGVVNRDGDVYHLGGNPSPNGPFKSALGNKPLRGASRLLMSIDDAPDFTPEQKESLIRAGQEVGKPEAVRNFLIQAANCPPMPGPDHIVVTKEQAEEILNGNPRYMSMGCVADTVECSICHAKVTSREDACTHLHPLTADYSKLEERVLAQLQGTLLQAPPMSSPRFQQFLDRTQRGPDTCSICGAVWPCAIPEHSRPGAHHLEMGWHKDPATGQPVFDEISLCPGPDPNGITDLK